MSFERHPVGTADLGILGLVFLVVEVEGGKAWISARKDNRSTSFERVYYSDGRWGRMESDPRVEWPRHSPMTIGEVSRDLLVHLGFMSVTDDMVESVSAVLRVSSLNMDAAIIMYS